MLFYSAIGESDGLWDHRCLAVKNSLVIDQLPDSDAFDKEARSGFRHPYAAIVLDKANARYPP